MNAPVVTGMQDSACLTDPACSFSGLLKPHTTTGVSSVALLTHWENSWNQVVEGERNRVQFRRHYDVPRSTSSRTREQDTNQVTWHAYAQSRHAWVQSPSALSESSLVAFDLSENWTGEWERLGDEIRAFLDLGEDWDGMGALPPSESLVQSVLELIECLRGEGHPPVTRATTTPSGTIILEWQGGGDYVEVEVVSPYRSEWMFVPYGRKPIHLALAGEIQDGR